MNDIWTILIIVAVLGIIIYIKHKFKIPKINNLVMITGGVKAGKTTLAVAMAIKEWKRNHKQWKFRKWKAKILKQEFDEEEPLLYSNVPIYKEYVPITEGILKRTERPNYKSIIYICEASLVSNAQNFKNEELNEEQLLFYKLIAHETKGGKVILDTQCIQDCHYSIKRSLSEYFYVHHTVKLPFFLMMYIREDRYSEDGSVKSVYEEDTEQTLQRVLIPKRTWKYFDCYCYSVLTDGLPILKDKRKTDKDNMKANRIVSFNKYKENYKKR